MTAIIALASGLLQIEAQPCFPVDSTHDPGKLEGNNSVECGYHSLSRPMLNPPLGDTLGHRELALFTSVLQIYGCIFRCKIISIPEIQSTPDTAELIVCLPLYALTLYSSSSSAVQVYENATSLCEAFNIHEDALQKDWEAFWIHVLVKVFDNDMGILAGTTVVLARL
ncbi:hypothetical protein BT96DRAFT_475087 [Gymnopus androsaceus JB14]|uniref:Uncharacterized protein n=1 Tax=Gymnopus androsaceus JB14 TaxID=1447944 RepID=A0A6A4GPP6_9AGAR|nr:hypothetical protein BT96DRAFT_475087 [Gymnopus androsaceus JB14]